MDEGFLNPENDRNNNLITNGRENVTFVILKIREGYDSIDLCRGKENFPGFYVKKCRVLKNERRIYNEEIQ